MNVKRKTQESYRLKISQLRKDRKQLREQKKIALLALSTIARKAYFKPHKGMVLDEYDNKLTQAMQKTAKQTIDEILELEKEPGG